MKTVLRFHSPWLLLLVVLIACSSSALGQDKPDIFEQCTATYKNFLESKKKGEIEDLQTAIDTGNEYLTKSATLEGGETVRAYISRQIPLLKDILQDKINFRELDRALTSRNVDATFSYGKKVLDKHPDNVEVMLAVANTGFVAVRGDNPNDKYNDDILRLAKSAISKLEGSSAPETAYFKTAKCPDSRTNAIGSMNFTIGNITWSRLKDKKGALPYLYKSVQEGCLTKDLPETYLQIASAYQEDFQKLEQDRIAKTNTAGDKETDESVKIVALELGYLNRMLDAKGRAYRAMEAEAEYRERKERLLADLKTLYAVRHKEDLSGFDSWLKTVGSEVMPDPGSTVTPVNEEPSVKTPAVGKTSVS